MKRVVSVAVMVAAVLIGTSAIVSLLCYGRYCCVAACLVNCHPFMSVDDLFEVVPERFHKQNEKILLENGEKVPYVGYFPSDYESISFKYTCCINSIDRIGMFVDSCTFYFNDKLQLVGFSYSAPGAYYWGNNEWNEFFLVFSSEDDTKGSELRNRIINVLDLRTGKSHLYNEKTRGASG